MSKVDVILKDPVVPEVLGRYLDVEAAELKKRYEQFLARLEARRFVVPVAGVQGSGKSTLLNALAFDTTVLPIDADETTCVPVEICFAENPSALAVVRYEGGTEEYVPATEASIAEFVHNHKNPGNQRKVDRVVVESNRPLLEHGLVLVDLPGTGSLTQSNVETTKRYLEEAVGVVFLLRTVPPLTRSESIFVAFHWARLPTAFFVQNRWTDERADEAEGGRQHNLLVLKQLAERNRIQLKADPTIHVVTAYQALRGRLSANAADVDSSGLTKFEEALADAAREWPSVLRAGIVEVVETDLQTALEAVERRKAEFSTDRDVLEATLRSEEIRFKKYLDDLQTTFDQTRSDVEAFVAEQRKGLGTWGKNAASEMRNQMRTKLRQGIVDGPRLSKALMDEQSTHADDVFELLQEGLLSFQDRLRERFSDIREWRPGKVGARAGINLEESRKWESAAEPVLSGGLAIGGMVAGTKLGALLGAQLGLAGGPLGMVIGVGVGAVAGLLGGLFGAWAGKKIRREVVLERAIAAEPEVFRAIDQFVVSTKADLSQQLEQFQQHIVDGLKTWLGTQQTRFENERKKTMGALNATKKEREAAIRELESDRIALEHWHSLMKETTP